LTEAPRALKLWLARVGWLALIWALSVGALAVVALILRGVMSAAGLTTPH
jgi:hypothetical protein